MTPSIQRNKRLKKFLGLALLVCLGVLFLPHFPLLLQVVLATLSATVRLVMDFVGIGIIALLLAVLLIPLETLGWWAGWYGDPIQTTLENLGELQEVAPTQTSVSRYVVYLDGIGQSEFDYLPDVERFLDDLAQSLPDGIKIIRGLMPYSPMNRALTNQSRPFAWFWNLANRLQSSGTGSILAFFINLRNIFVVTVSADSRYGPIYNRGTAQVIYNSLINHGYVPGSGLPITLIGFSGGGQISMGAAPYLKDALLAPIDIISIAGVFSGNNNSLKLEHLYHLVGDKDIVERAGPIFFPKRWKLLFLSYWNRTKRMGKVSLIDLGPVGHQVPGGVMDPGRFLPDGRSYLQQTVEWVTNILQGSAALEAVDSPQVASNLDRYRESPFNRPEFYPLDAMVASDRYHPVANWIGRLILPTADQRQPQAVPFEVHHAPTEYRHLIGQVVTLRWSDDPKVQAYVQQVTKDVHFSPQAEYRSQQGCVFPTRLNHWRLVDPLESLAGAHPIDDVIVALPDPVRVQASDGLPITLSIAHEPIQITGRYYGLVQFLAPVDAIEHPERFRVVHFNKRSQRFDGAEEIVWLPQVVADDNGTYPFTNQGIEQSPLNETGWYIYGAMGEAGFFVVQAIAPRALFQLYPTQEIVGRKAVRTFLKQTSWADLSQQKGQISSTILSHSFQAIESNKQHWQVGTRALLVHVYGGIGGNKIEPSAQGPVYFGHFAFGVATIIREPLTDELRFDIVYHQIYTQNPDGLIAGSLAWSRYMGDRQFGWIGLRPVSDTLINFAPFTDDYEVAAERERSPLDVLIRQLEVMAARYRIGDGTGGTYVGPANNCSQDSNQSLYAALTQMARSVNSNHADIKKWMRQHPDQAQRLAQLQRLGKDLKSHLMPFGSARADWSTEATVLGSTLEDDPLQTLARGIVSWRTVLPRVANDSIIECFLRQGATAWMLRTNQLGGHDPEIEPIAPLTF